MVDMNRKVWNEFYRSVYLYKDYICDLWMLGVEELNINRTLPDFMKINTLLSEDIKLKMVNPVCVDRWFNILSQGYFPVYSNFRSINSLHHSDISDFCHDMLGHIPYLKERFIIDSILKFAKIYTKKTEDTQKHNLIKTWFYLVEFGLIKEQGSPKVFGGGAITSKKIMDKFLSGDIAILEFNYDSLFNFNITSDGDPEALFLFSSVTDLFHQLDKVYKYVI